MVCRNRMGGVGDSEIVGRGDMAKVEVGKNSRYISV